jgi:preprotein translocase subunit SecA
VDEFTGRIMPGRRWSDGLHQAIEAKEGVRIERENQTLATISFQNYFKLYKKIAGMTGTALTESVEFKEIYNTDVIALPTNKELQRTEHDDEIYKTENDKFKVITEEIEKTFKENRPILIGTASIEKAEKLSRYLSRKNIPHNVLHGKNHEAEAAIIAQAGRPRAVTIATQMAGRGVDIILGGNPEILAREETIKVIWSRKKTKTGDKNREQEFAGVLTEIENTYKKRLSDAEKNYKAKIDSIRQQLNEKESVFVSLDRKANDLFERTVFSKQGGGSFERYQPRLLKLRELHDRASADLAEAQNTFKDKQERLKDFKEAAGRTYREYLAFKNSLKARFGIVLQEDIEEKRNSMTEMLNSAEASSAEGIRKILTLLESYEEAIKKYLSIFEDTFSTKIPVDKGLFQKARGKQDRYIEYIRETAENLTGNRENVEEVLKRFRENESRLYSPYLEIRNTLEKEIKAGLLEEDYSSAEKEYKRLLTEYEKEYAQYDTELKKAREEYEQNRTRYEDEWQKAREELEKTPEEFKEVYESLLERYKTPWQEDHQKVVEAGGLHVIGSERYEARRIDNQLKGRAGRQGDPGSSKFYLSLDDDLLRIFGSERMLGVMGHLPEGEAITHPLITKMINNAQKKVEARNFEIRKQLLEFDNVLNEQRKIIYALRQDILEGKNLNTYIKEFMEETLEEGFEEFMSLQVKPFMWNMDNFRLLILNTFGIKVEMPQSESIRNPIPWREQLKDELLKKIQDAYEEKGKEVGQYLIYIQKIIMLQVIDNRWKAHLRVIDELREGISLRAYAQRDPLLAYKHEGYQEFQTMLSFIKKEILSFLFRVQVSEGQKTPQTEIPEQVPIVPHTDMDITYGHKNLGQFDVTKKDKAPGEHETDREIQTGKIESGPLPAPPSNGNLLQGKQQPKQPYVRGKKKIGRNDPCPCGSGKKYKNCCGRNL